MGKVALTVLPPPIRGGRGGGGSLGAGSSGIGPTTIGGGKGLISTRGLMGIIGGAGGIAETGLMMGGPGSSGDGNKTCGDRIERCFELIRGKELALSSKFSSQSFKESLETLISTAMESGREKQQKI